MSTIRIQRTNEYQNAFRKINIHIDGKNVGKVENGKTVEFSVETGDHSLVAKIDWCRSHELKLECKENSMNTVRLSGNKSIFLTLYYTTFARRKYLTLTEIN